MFDFLYMGGPFMYLLAVIATVVLWLAVKNTILLYRQNGDTQKSTNINAILFWGCIALLLGVFGHFMGIYQAMQAIMAANDISPAIVAGGYVMSLSTIIFGMGILLFSSVSWFYLKSR
jgi:uncharacterized membrane protein